MADDRLHTTLRRLDVPASPSATFAESLYREVAPLALAAGRRDRTWYGGLVAVLRGAPSAIGRPLPALRQAVLIAVLLALLLMIAALVGSRPPDPNKLVRLSEGVYLNPPPFDMTVAYDNRDVRRYRFDGADTLRLDVVAGSYRDRPVGAAFVSDVGLNRLAETDPRSGTTSVVAIPAGLRPLSQLDLRWGADFTNPGRPFNTCKEWEFVGDEVVAKRPTRHVRCLDVAGRREEFWIDEGTRFIIRSTDVPTADPQVRIAGEVLTLELGRRMGPAPFEFADGDPHWGGPMLGGDTPFEPGARVVSARFIPAIAATPGEGWRSWGSTPDAVGLVRGDVAERETDGGGVFFIRLSAVTDPETGRDVPMRAGSQAMLEWLRGHPYLALGEVAETRIGSVAAVTMPIREALPDGFEKRCPVAEPGQPVPPCRRWFPSDGGYWSFGRPPDEERVSVLEVHGSTILVHAYANGPNAATHMDAIDGLLATIEFLE